MKRLLPLATVAIILGLYLAVAAFGLWLKGRAIPWTTDTPQKAAWHVAHMPDLEAVAYGRSLFTETPVYANHYTKSRVACASCHLGAGTAPYSAPVIGSTQAYPQFSKRAGRKINLDDRIEECMTRSENGTPLPADSKEMLALKAYINWLSTPHPDQLKYTGRGLEPLPELTPDPQHGAQVYAAQCAGCHGSNGEGARRPFPPLWGSDSFNDGAGMYTLPKLTAFIHANMPQNRKGVLSPQDATDVAAFIRQQPRPTFNHAFDKF
jgi:thiosulfate dehydrogenase